MKALNKKKKVNIVRNVLASPFEKYWPLLNADDSGVLSEVLLKVLPSAAISKGFLSQKKLKQIYREENASKRKRLWKQKENSSQQSKEEVEKAKSCRKSLLLGVNCVTRGLETSDVAACLISGDASPRLIVEHIITSAARSGVPVLVVPSLKKVSQSALAFPCLSLGLHKHVAKEKDNTFYGLYELILKLGKKFNVPDHLQISPNSDNESDSKLEISVDDEPIIASSPSKENTTKGNSLNTFQYLKRSSVNQRAFIPPKPDENLCSDVLKFIPISGQEGDAVLKSGCKYTLSEQSSDEICSSDSDSSCKSQEAKTSLIDVKGVKNTIKVPSNLKRNRSNFKPTIVKKVKSNPNKKKQKVS